MLRRCQHWVRTTPSTSASVPFDFMMVSMHVVTDFINAGDQCYHPRAWCRCALYALWSLRTAICMRVWCVRNPRIFEHRRSRVSILILINLSSRAALFFSPWEPRYCAHALHVGAWGCAPRCDGSGRVGWDRSECECSGSIGPRVAVRPTRSATKSACVRTLRDRNRAQMPGRRPVSNWKKECRRQRSSFALRPSS